jgi:hypothetical protein
MINVQGNQAPAKQQKTLKKFKNSYTKTTAKQAMSSQADYFEGDGSQNQVKPVFLF